MIVEKYTNSVNLEKIKKIRRWRALNRLFSKKQIRILKKMNAFEELTKTEKEIYSRVIKPRLNAVIDLHEFSIHFREGI